MKLVDANVLLYADDVAAPHHQVSRSWLVQALSAPEPVLVAWLSVIAYLRISTLVRLHQNPRSLTGAMTFVRTVLATSPPRR